MSIWVRSLLVTGKVAYTIHNTLLGLAIVWIRIIRKKTENDMFCRWQSNMQVSVCLCFWFVHFYLLPANSLPTTAKRVSNTSMTVILQNYSEAFEITIILRRDIWLKQSSIELVCKHLTDFALLLKNVDVRYFRERQAMLALIMIIRFWKQSIKWRSDMIACRVHTYE